jgi:ankyrin repeat protein
MLAGQPGIDLNARGDDGMSAVAIAAFAGAADIVRFLVAVPEVDVRDLRGAIARLSPEIAALLRT